MIIDKPAYVMIYQEETARRIKKVWKVPTSALTRWKKLGIIPDVKALGEPLTKAELATEQKLIRLIEAGWLKARPISRKISDHDKINALLTARRYPNDSRFRVHHLSTFEIKLVKSILDRLYRSVGSLLFIASVIPDGQPYSDVVQSDLRALLRLQYVSSVNIKVGMNSRQIARFWAFVRGGNAKRDDLNLILNKLKALLEICS